MKTLRDLTPERLQSALTVAVHEAIKKHMDVARPGHCLRVSTLDEKTMRDLCSRLGRDYPEVDVVLLLGPRQPVAEGYEVSATRLVELRNQEQKPLLVFVPSGTRTAAEDSFGVSTFAEVELGEVPKNLRQALRSQLPDRCQVLTDRAIAYLGDTEKTISDEDVVRYYLTILDNIDLSTMLEPEHADVAGAAIYQLHLVPDYALYQTEDRIKQRLNRNVEAVSTLVSGANTLLGRIHQLRLEPNTIQAELFRFLGDRQLDATDRWGADIACDVANAHLSFDQWRFEGEAPDGRHLMLYVDDLDLPAREKDSPIGPDNPRYLDVARAKSVRIKWQTDPKPSVVDDLAYFRVEIVSTEGEGGAIAWESKSIPVGKSPRQSRSKSLKTVEFREQFLEPEADGLYFFRVRAYSESGDILNVEDADEDPRILRDPGNPEGKRQNESEDVWFWVGGEPPPAEAIRNTNVESFLEAQLLARLAAVDRGSDPFSADLQPQPDRTCWAVGKRSRADATYNIVFDAQSRFTLSLSNQLRNVESETLRQPYTLGRWRLNYALTGADRQSAKPVLRPYLAPERVPEPFMQARARLFEAIRSGEADRLVSTVDLAEFSNGILEYVDEYLDWLRTAERDFVGQTIIEDGGRKRSDPLVLDLDLVEVLLPGEEASPSRVYLAGPTHPLRLLWHLQRFELANAWLRAAQDSGRAPEMLTPSLRTYLRRRLVPVNLPPVLRSGHDGYPLAVPRFYVEHGPLTSFWGLYLREDTLDSRTLETRTRAAMGISREVAVPGAVDGDSLAHSIQRYLIQHPYVHTLKVNVFNPGDARLLVSALLRVEGTRLKSRLPALRYELRLFTHSDALDDVGTAIADLLNPERQVSAEADAFSVASNSPLYPKLHYSRSSLDDFLKCPDRFEAHISLLQDLFAVDVTLQKPAIGRSSYLHGLIQEHVTFFPSGHLVSDEPASAEYVWYRQLLPTPCLELPESSVPNSARIADVLAAMAVLSASVAAGNGRVEEVIPTLHLALRPADKSLLNEVHAVSDWVFTVDRHLGLDYFDRDASDSRPIYLLDYRPEYGGTDTERLLLTTRSVEEIERLILPALQERDPLLPDDVDSLFLNVLRSLSGRVALKLLSAPTQVSEALGLGFARLFLEQYELLEDKIVLPLDAHTELFAPQSVDPLVPDVALLRSDLLLVSCEPETRTLSFQVIEVKFHSDVGEFGAYVTLKQHIEAQVTSSINVLRGHFDPDLGAVDRLDRQVKVKELASLLSFYLERSRRYGTVSAQSFDNIRGFLATLDQGYKLTCCAVGLVFDQGTIGLEVDEEHPGLLYYRVGKDYLSRLLRNGLRRRELLRNLELPALGLRGGDSPLNVAKPQEDTTFATDPTFARVRTGFTPSFAEHTDTFAKEARSIEVRPTISAPQKDEAKAGDRPIEGASEAQDSGRSTEGMGTIEASESTPGRPSYDVLLGDTAESRQYGLLGIASGRRVAIDLDGTNTISLFGVQGSGKSYTVGMIAEMASQGFSGVNALPSPLATVIFHYHQSQDYPPEFVSMALDNSDESAIATLAREYGALPGHMDDVLVLTSSDKLEQRRKEFGGLAVEPISFSSDDLTFRDWRFLMGVGGNQMYMKQINLIMRQLRGKMTLESLRDEVERSDLSEGQKSIARIRLRFAEQFLNDNMHLAQVLRPGRLVIVDLRDEFIDKEEALGLFVVMLDIFANAQDGAGKHLNKMIVFDEAHKYMDNPDLTGHIVDVIRQMRHQGVSVLIASQDPPSLPSAIIELSSLVILHRFNSPQWLKHIQRSVTALADLSPAQMAGLRPGEAFVWAAKSTERVFTQKAVKMQFRPRVTQHGGGTKTAT